MDRYKKLEFDGITVWYDKKIVPEKSGKPIRIDGRKIFLGLFQLNISGVKEYAHAI